MSNYKDVENPINLDKRAVDAKQSEEEAKVLIEEFLPFLRVRVSRYSMYFSDHLHEDILSTAMMALYEGIQKYDIEKGHFFPFADRVVRARIVDHVRKIIKQENKTIHLGDNDENTMQSSAINVISMRNYDEEQRRTQLAEEIESFISEIATWGITMETLTKGSPKHKELRKTYRAVIREILKEPQIIQTINLKRYFPIKAISKITGLPQKKLERARTYIIAVLIIKAGDYELLSEYIGEGGNE